MQHFAEQELVQAIQSWVQIGSSTFNVAGVNRVMTAAEADCRRIGMTIERIPGTQYGDILLAHLPSPQGETEGGILVLGHLDTIQLDDEVVDNVEIRTDGDKVFGTGILDMKGGMRCALYSLEMLLREKKGPQLPVTFLFIPDEEIGSPSSRSVIEAVAAKYQYVLVPEPTRDGVLVTGRHAFLRYNLTTRGRSAHAGSTLSTGASAIRAMADLIKKVEGWSDRARQETYSVGVVRGGTFVNVVSPTCFAEVLCVAPDNESFERIQSRMASLDGASIEGASVSVHPGVIRPLFTPNEGTMKLFELARSIAAESGVELRNGQLSTAVGFQAIVAE